MSKKTEPPGCGKSNLWFFKGYFFDDCRWHDELYDHWESPTFDLDWVDSTFLQKMLLRAGKNKWRIAQAYTLYYVAHIYGVFRRWMWKRKMN